MTMIYIRFRQSKWFEVTCFDGIKVYLTNLTYFSSPKSMLSKLIVLAEKVLLMSFWKAYRLTSQMVYGELRIRNSILQSKSIGSAAGLF
jgi:hypothetical protein